MLRFLIIPLVILVLIALYNIIKQLMRSYSLNRERMRREEEHREYMMAYNTRRQLYSEVYSVSRKFKLEKNEDTPTQENLSTCCDDDEVDIAYNQASRKYEVSFNGGVIGYLPSQASGVMKSIGEHKAVITEMGISSNDKYFAHISIFSNE